MCRETYQYYDLPFCRPGGADGKLKHKREGLGEVVDGNRQVHFLTSVLACFHVLLSRGSTFQGNCHHI